LIAPISRKEKRAQISVRKWNKKKQKETSSSAIT